MSDHPVEFVLGVPERFRQEAVELFDLAFGAKFSVAIRSRPARLELLSRCLELPFGFAAICDERLVGLAGINTADGSLTGNLNYRQLISGPGFLRGTWAAMIFGLYERKRQPGELLMDGIAVHPDMRGRGIGTGLLSEISRFASDEGYECIRLDVIDTNPDARRLYERNRFVADKTEHFGYLRWLLGFGASTTMIQTLSSDGTA